MRPVKLSLDKAQLHEVLEAMTIHPVTIDIMYMRADRSLQVDRLLEVIVLKDINKLGNQLRKRFEKPRIGRKEFKLSLDIDNAALVLLALHRYHSCGLANRQHELVANEINNQLWR